MIPPNPSHSIHSSIDSLHSIHMKLFNRSYTYQQTHPIQASTYQSHASNPSHASIPPFPSTIHPIHSYRSVIYVTFDPTNIAIKLRLNFVMAPCKRQVKATRHLIRSSCSNWVDSSSPGVRSPGLRFRRVVLVLSAGYVLG